MRCALRSAASLPLCQAVPSPLDVLHQASVSIDDKGTVAAAATAITGVGVSSAIEPPQPKVVRIDHPFLFVIRDNPTGAVLFVGQVVAP